MLVDGVGGEFGIVRATWSFLEAHPDVIVVKFIHIVCIVQFVARVANTVCFTDGTSVTKVLKDDDGASIVNKFDNCFDF